MLLTFLAIVIIRKKREKVATATKNLKSFERKKRKLTEQTCEAVLDKDELFDIAEPHVEIYEVRDAVFREIQALQFAQMFQVSDSWDLITCQIKSVSSRAVGRRGENRRLTR